MMPSTLSAVDKSNITIKSKKNAAAAKDNLPIKFYISSSQAKNETQTSTNSIESLQIQNGEMEVINNRKVSHDSPSAGSLFLRLGCVGNTFNNLVF